MRSRAEDWKESRAISQPRAKVHLEAPSEVVRNSGLLYVPPSTIIHHVVRVAHTLYLGHCPRYYGCSMVCNPKGSQPDVRFYGGPCKVLC